MSATEPTSSEEPNAFKRSHILEFIGSRGNLAGMGLGVVGLIAGEGIIHRPPLALGLTLLTYGAGYLLGRDYSKDVTFDLKSHGDRVEVHEIQQNLSSLRSQVAQQRARLPKNIVTQLDETFGLVEELLPRWSQLKSFTEQKYTINQIVTDYLPTIIANYINLPASYYHNAAKKQVGTEVEQQLILLNRTLLDIREDIFKNAERNITAQGTFLKDKFTGESNSLLRL